MPAFPWTDVAIILALIALNGFFAMAELAIVSARRPRLQAMQRAGRRGAGRALALAADSGRFLSAVQIGITLIGVANGAFSGASLAGPVAARLEGWFGLSASVADDVGFALVIVIVTYVSLIIGELVPKQFALRAPEPLAAAVAPAMDLLTRVTRPFVFLLDQSSQLVFRLLRLKRDADHAVTEEELRSMVTDAESAGVIEESERALISGIMRLADRPVRGVMTPRVEVDWLDASAGEDEVRARLIATPHTRIVVADGNIDTIIGVVQARDALAALLEGRPLDLRALAKAAPAVPDVADATDALTALRDAAVPMALVIDEYGHFEGVVTPADLLAAIAGEFKSDMDDELDPHLVTREDGSLLVSGGMAADELAETLGFELPEERDYQTVAGFVLAELEHIPATGEHFEARGWRFEVIDMDGRKIDKLLVSRVQPDP
ncbi:hemolysin family protein [Sandaracinobacteroides saxicola]|uniref:HlyC/CorC family transporter n=1 Tax=Sandaracinobacteroides saxicola TaxID=2759707 RepID=A0A7G5IIB2_9SPHN|nr:hemolysin family protein [Sandaracinobacteroides saxicola]QMW23104.1 HlyC/CorC family transporter [Sandaracinobacteroides saxicola]